MLYMHDEPRAMHDFHLHGPPYCALANVCGCDLQESCLLLTVAVQQMPTDAQKAGSPFPWARVPSCFISPTCASKVLPIFPKLCSKLHGRKRSQERRERGAVGCTLASVYTTPSVGLGKKKLLGRSAEAWESQTCFSSCTQ